ATLLALHLDLYRGDRLPLVVHGHRVAALRVAGAAEERATRALALRHRLAALLADVLRLHHRGYRLPVGVDVERFLAARIARARQERPALVLGAHQGLAALGAFVLGLARRGGGFPADWPSRLALGIFRAAKKLTGATELHDHRRAADVANLRRGD